MVIRRTAPAAKPTLLLEPGRPLRLDEFFAVTEGRATFEFSKAAKARMAASQSLLEEMVSTERRIYGVTTGYGPLACHHVAPEHAGTLQRNLIYHLASGVGPEYGREETRAILSARIVSLSQGHSAIRIETMQFLLQCLEEDLLPVVPEMGTVGASGDLTPLAHLALGWLGQSEVHWRGQRMPAREALSACGLEPLELTFKEGLALVNGTSAMTGLAARNAVLSRRALDWALRWTACYAEALDGKAQAWDARFGQVRPHPGQQEAHRRLGRLILGSGRLEYSLDAPRLSTHLAEDGLIPDQSLLQGAYSIRCAPQIYGAVLDVLEFHDRIVETELNSVTDNPIFFAEDAEVLHGGNFYGQHVAFASDALHMAVLKIAIHVERKIARITDCRLNGGLPAFLQPRQLGLQSGFMGAQVTASAIVAEMRSEATPASIQSIPTNGNNQDVVPMGTIAARKARRAIGHLYRLLAIDAMVMAQAMELRADRDSIAAAGFSPAAQHVHGWLRQTVAPLIDDRPLGSEIEALAIRLRQSDLEPV